MSDIEEIEVETTTSKKNVFYWAMYDLANTIFSMIIVSLIINRYVLVIGQLEYGLEYGEVSLLFGIVSSIMQVCVAILVPIIGALSDNAGRRKPFVLALTVIILIFASLLGFSHDIILVLFFFVIANMAYQFANTFYDAMLPFIAKREDIGKVAGFGVAWGYFGTIISLLVILPFMLGNDMVSDPAQGTPSYGYTNDPIVFIIPMILFLVFTIPFIFVQEKRKPGKMPSIFKLIKASFRQVKETLHDIRGHKPMFIFIIGYFLVVDVANVLVAYMMALVTDGLVIGTGGVPSDMFGSLFIVLSTVSAVVFTYFIGKFGEKHGGKKTFYLVGILWGISIGLGSFTIFTWPYVDIGLNLPFILSLIVGLVSGPALGGTWTAQRIMVTELAPKEKFGEYFGFSKLSGKLSSAVGPLIFGAVLSTYSIIGKYAYGWALIAVGIIMALGLFIISLVNKK